MGKLIAMKPTNMKRVIWENLTALMESHWGAVNLNQLAREAGIGPASVTRIKNQETSIGIDLLEKLASIFDLQPWQLLVPGLNPGNLPVLSVGGDTEQIFYKTLESIRKEIVVMEERLGYNINKEGEN